MHPTERPNWHELLVHEGVFLKELLLARHLEGRSLWRAASGTQELARRCQAPGRGREDTNNEHHERPNESTWGDQRLSLHLPYHAGYLFTAPGAPRCQVKRAGGTLNGRYKLPPPSYVQIRRKELSAKRALLAPGAAHTAGAKRNVHLLRWCCVHGGCSAKRTPLALVCQHHRLVVTFTNGASAAYTGSAW